MAYRFDSPPHHCLVQALTLRQTKRAFQQGAASNLAMTEDEAEEEEEEEEEEDKKRVRERKLGLRGAKRRVCDKKRVRERKVGFRGYSC